MRLKPTRGLLVFALALLLLALPYLLFAGRTRDAEETNGKRTFGVSREQPSTRARVSATTHREDISPQEPEEPTESERTTTEAEAAPTTAAIADLVERLLASDRAQATEEIGRLIEDALDRWGDDPRFPSVLFRCIEKTEDADSPEALALALLVRSWLAVAAARGEHDPQAAQEFVTQLVRRAFGEDSTAWRKMLMRTLSEPGDSLPGHQLTGLPALGDLLLAHLPESGEGRGDALDLLHQWSRRQGPVGESFLRGLLTLPDSDLHAVAYRGLFELREGERSALLAEVATRDPEVISDLAEWLAGRSDLISGEKVFEWLESIPRERFPEELAHDLGMTILTRLQDGGATAERLYRQWSANAEDPRARSLRIGVLRSALLLRRTTPIWNELLLEAAHDANLEIASSALHALGHLAPELAAGRLMDLAAAADASQRGMAMSCATNTLRNLGADAPLIDSLMALLEDPRLSLPERQMLSRDLERFRRETIEAWRRRNGL